MGSSASKEQEVRRFTGTVPDDLIRYILLRVPSETLVGCKSVCKTWLSLISSPDFAKSHLAITAAQEEEDIHIVRAYANAYGSEDSISLINLGTRQLVTRLNFPSEICHRIVGSACGIVCIRTTIADLSKMYLWNPATNQSKCIPHPSFVYGDEALGFGFDEIDNDFKIIRVVWHLKRTCYSKEYYGYCVQDCDNIYVEVYSSKRNAWRENRTAKLTDLPYHYGNFDVSVNTGLLCSAGCYGIISFNLHTEVPTCGAVNYPIPTFDANINTFNPLDGRALITNFKDSIAVIIHKHRRDSNYDMTRMFNLWALDNVASLRGGGIQASWTLIFNIDVNLPIDLVHGYLSTGDFLLYLFGKDLCLYNSDNKEAKYFRHSFYFGEIFKYSKSLFTVPGFKPVNWNVPPPEAD